MFEDFTPIIRVENRLVTQFPDNVIRSSGDGGIRELASEIEIEEFNRKGRQRNLDIDNRGC